MKKIFTILTAGVLALVAFSSCVREQLAVYDETKVTAPVLGTYNVGEDVITANFTPAKLELGFNEKLVPSHTLAVVSLNGEEKSKSLTTSNDGATITLKTVNLAKALITLGAKEGSTAKVELAVRATLQDVSKDNGRNGFVDSEKHIVINSFEVVIPEQVGSPYEEYTEASDWSLIGAMSAYEINWDGDLNMWATQDGNQHVAAHVILKAGDQVKFRKDQAWTVNMGGTLGTLGDEFAVTQDGPNIEIAKDGVYDLFLDLSAGTAIVAEAFDPYPDFTQATNWTVIGALSKHGISWDGDIDMLSDGTVSAAFSVALAADDEFKFRRDKAWTVNLGGEFGGMDTDFAVSQDGPNIKVGAEGVYDLFVDPSANTAKVTAAAGVKVSSKIGAGGDEPEPQPVEVKGWNIIGLNGDWENDVLASEKDGVWTAYITATEATSFKWRKDAGWDENYGIAKDATFTMGTAFAAVAGGENISVAAGFYKVTLDLTNTEAPMITVYDDFVVWSLIGDFNSWGGDVDMIEDGGKWIAKGVALKGGWKIRKNHDWADNRGGKFEALGTAFAVTAGGDNIDCGEGEFNVTYDPAAETVTVDPALPSNTWSLIGVNGDWNNDIFMTELMPGVWVSPVVETTTDWKVRFNHGWDVNRGAAAPSAEGVFVKAVPGGPNINVTGKFTVIYNANSETIGTLVWGVVGSIASIDGFSWNKDVPMNLASDGKWYSVPVALTTSDEIKIRQYAGWDVNFGGDLVEADAAFAAVSGGNNIKAPKDGTYMVVYDPAAATLTLSTQFWGLIGGFNSWGGDKFMIYDGEKWCAYGQNIEGEWKIRQGSGWDVNRGGTFVEKDAAIDAVAGGSNITVTGLTDWDVVYVPSAEKIFVGDAANVSVTVTPAVPDNWKDSATDISAAGTANCYIVTAAGAYKFPAVKGNGTDSVGSVASASIVWESCNNAEAVTANSVIWAVDADASYVYFLTPNTLKAGNALVAAKDSDGKILWSWHIWIPSTTIATNTYGLFNHELMDRNLGALVAAKTGEAAPVESFGLTYQWGRKDPFVGPAATSGSSNAALSGAAPELASATISLEESIANPTLLGHTNDGDWLTAPDNTLWQNDTKTIYDPCPAGYKVPARDKEQPLMNADLSTVTGWSENATNGYITLGDPVAVFPVSGYRDDYEVAKMAKVYQRVAYWTSYASADAKGYLLNIRLADYGNAHALGEGPKARGGYVRCVKLEAAE